MMPQPVLQLVVALLALMVRWWLVLEQVQCEDCGRVLNYAHHFLAAHRVRVHALSQHLVLNLAMHSVFPQPCAP